MFICFWKICVWLRTLVRLTWTLGDEVKKYQKRRIKFWKQYLYNCFPWKEVPDKQKDAKISNCFFQSMLLTNLVFVSKNVTTWQLEIKQKVCQKCALRKSLSSLFLWNFGKYRIFQPEKCKGFRIWKIPRDGFKAASELAGNVNCFN